MNKAQAAEYLAVSTRAIERYTTKGRLTPKYEPGRTGPAPVYDRTQLDTLKAEMQKPVLRPTVKHDKPAQTDKPDKDDKSNGLMLRSGSRADLAALIAAIDGARATSVTDLSHKLALTEKEAARLSGYPLSQIRAARKAGRLKATLTGSGWRVKRRDLDVYVSKF